ncbi:hypothetical protein [Gemmobacter nectariphilus]|uniref:hypothetical protein n=2 Tax=Gemmobacter nectariphilus TaxID=220343 RepID=UPI0004110156|nr:hypothetical protein [Gemmobacter nectariphilus]
MTYDRAAIMKAAHVAARGLTGHPMMKGRTYAQNFAGQLRRVWAEAKARAQAEAMAKAAKPKSAADRIREAIFLLECKDRLEPRDWAALDAMRADLRRVTYAAAA